MSVANKCSKQRLMSVNKAYSSFANTDLIFTNFSRFFLPVLAILCVLILTGCYRNEARPHSINVQFVPYFNLQAIKCDGLFRNNENKQNKLWRIHSLGFYASSLYLNNDPQALNLLENDWQLPHLSLLWFANNCGQAANVVAKNHQLSFTLPTQKSWQQASSLSFVVAVPFEDNHQNPLLQKSPLNMPEMFWSWRNGHKFMRLDMSQISTGENSEQQANNWSFHLGSLACESASSLRSPIKPCKQANRFRIHLDLSKFGQQKPNTITVKFDIAQLVKHIELGQAQSCMFDYSQQTQCNTIINNLEQNSVFSVLYNAE